MKRNMSNKKIFKIYHQKLVHDTASFLDIQKIMRVEYRGNLNKKGIIFDDENSS